MNKTALVIGSTGLVGYQLVKQLLENKEYSTVKTFSRRPTGLSNPKLQEVILDFDNLEEYRNEFKGDVLFSCLGTTKKKAGSKEVQYKIDVTYQLNAAKIASQNGVPNYALVSSSGANAKSSVFYSRIKGELEEEIKKLHFNKIRIHRPSVLHGSRSDKRMGEELSVKLINGLMPIMPFLKRYKPIKGNEVAKALINSIKSDDKLAVYELAELFEV